jgi:hypothetical protein
VIKGATEEEAVLCTGDKTFALKLVETTNLLLLLPPQQVGHTCATQRAHVQSACAEWLHANSICRTNQPPTLYCAGTGRGFCSHPQPAYARSASSICSQGIRSQHAAARVVLLLCCQIVQAALPRPKCQLPIASWQQGTTSTDSSPLSICALCAGRSADATPVRDVGLQTQLQKVGPPAKSCSSQLLVN